MSFQSHPIGMRLTWPLLSKAAFGSIISSAFLPSPVRAQSACPNPVPVTIAPPNLDAPSATLVPNDVCTPKQIPGGNPIAYFDDYSWRTFVALVWPGLSGHRGTPDTVENLSKANVPVVFLRHTRPIGKHSSQTARNQLHGAICSLPACHVPTPNPEILC